MKQETIEAHGLTAEEYERIVQLLGREPNLTELGIFSVMWSEHCSYKSSKVHLKRLPTSGEAVVQGPGENAGILDIGEGWCVAFKIESHNHPSFIEPYQGAATGVGGILRDIFTMGARPVAAMNSLRFGPIADENNEGIGEDELRRNRAIVNGVVRGIGDYGNCFGVPTVGGEVSFGRCYSLNPLVNAFALGLVRRDQIFYGKAAGIGNAVIYVGAKTGRDGIHGATMASAEFDEEAIAKRPTVQVGDPFTEKLLLESCLEAMRSGAVVGIQDMGAAGLTCSTCEMGARAGTGIEIELSLVPQREEGMSPYEIMLSESQERMLLVVAHGREREVIEIFQRWDLDAVVIGAVTDGGLLRVRNGGELVAEIPAAALTDEAPVYHRPLSPPPPEANALSPGEIAELAASLGEEAERSPAGYTRLLETLLESPNGASKEWVYRQYDHTVRTNTVVLPGSDAAVIRVKETRHAIAMSLDGNGRYCAIDPREGAKLVVAEAARNVVCAGARPLAATNCLNFASPENPEVMWQLSETIDGMAEACRALGTPITGGNVSFYNETGDSRIAPTPVIGMVGLIEDAKQTMTSGFKGDGEVIILIGETIGDLSGSALVARFSQKPSGQLPPLDLARESAVQGTVLEAIQNEWVKSAHDCSDGGLAVALAESCFSSYGRGASGAQIELVTPLGAVTELFAESPSRVLLSVTQENADHILALAIANGVQARILGATGGDRLQIAVNGSLAIDSPVNQLERSWRGVLPEILDSPSKLATVASAEFTRSESTLMAVTNPIVQKLLHDVTENRGALWDSIDGVTEEEAQRSPGGNDWTIAQILDHLLKSENATAKLYRRKLAEAQQRQIARETRTDQELGPVSDLLQRYGSRRDAPELVRPDAGRSLPQLRAELEESHRKLVDAIHALSDYDLSLLSFPHPIFGELDLYRWILIGGWHELRHANQIREIRRQFLQASR